jgi:hypothetical protein
MALAASSLVSKLNLWVKTDDFFTTDSKIITCLACNKGWVFSEISCTKHTTYKEQVTEFVEEASALSTDTAFFFYLKKQILQEYV